jgi:aspartyl-tRNA(Asn)/glutamyl-tRNA(Gln) amidotransferase subunit C
MIRREDVDHVALLAHVALTEAERVQFTEQLSSILEHIAVLNEAQVDTTAPITSIQALQNVMRPDVVCPSYPPDEILANAPDREDDFVRVCAVFDE